uniref:Uncharacterized protein n=1 Tax=Lactuca sativa TaxID=4236 RepID=A0A9R1V1K8_LACSA|nr:hypothetical protein LSAT_V11C700369410 [Lactuca sativa]
MRQQRAMELIKDYDCEILYHPGKANVVADALSRKVYRNSMCYAITHTTVKFTILDELEKWQEKALNPENVKKEGMIHYNDALLDDPRGLKECLVCLQVKAEHQKPYGTPESLSVPVWKWEELSMDFITKLPNTARQHDSIWVIVDRLTKSAHFLAMRETAPMVCH